MFKQLVLMGLVVIALGSARANAASQAAFPSFPDWGEPTKLTGALSKPKGQGPFPAVVMLHPCSGVSSKNGDMWEKRLLDWGYVVLRVDSFGPRGFKNTCKYEVTGSYDEDVFVSDFRVEDAYGGKQYLSTLAYVNKDRIGMIGWSHGGGTVLHTLSAGPPVDPFDAAIALYPGCGVMLMEINAPLLLLIGKNDTWSTASVCEKLEQPNMGANKFTRIVYPGAFHGFDKEGANYKYEGRTVLYDAAAAADAKNRVKAFLAKHLK